MNDENMVFTYSFAKLIKIKDKAFINSMKSFKGLPHRFEIFLKKKELHSSMTLKPLHLKLRNLHYLALKIFIGY